MQLKKDSKVTKKFALLVLKWQKQPPERKVERS